MYNYVEMENMKTTMVNMKTGNQVESANMKRENQELKARMDQNNHILLQALKAIQTCMVSAEHVDAT